MTVLQQGIRRFPINLRPILAVPKSRSTKGMGYLAKGFMRLQRMYHRGRGKVMGIDKAESALQWLVGSTIPVHKGYSGACWGNHFDYQSRSFYLPKGVPTIVWTSLIGHAFLDAYDHFRNDSYLQVAISACEHIVRDLDTLAEGDALCLSYIPTQNKQVHNSNTLGASLLARTYSHTRNEDYRSLAEKAIRYTANHQRPDGSWYYGEAANLHWVDNFHTAYVLDCFKHYATATGDEQFEGKLSEGYQYWKRTFFLADGTPRYYDHKTLPLDIQCSSQAIDTLVFFHDRDPENLSLALNVAKWTIENMQEITAAYFLLSPLLAMGCEQDPDAALGASYYVLRTRRTLSTSVAQDRLGLHVKNPDYRRKSAGAVRYTRLEGGRERRFARTATTLRCCARAERATCNGTK